MDTTSKSPLLTIRQFSQLPRYSAVFSEQRMRAVIAGAKAHLGARGNVIPANGLYETRAIVRVGKRIYIDVDRFEAWLQCRDLANLPSKS